MFESGDLRGLVELAGSHRLRNGWVLAVRADWCDVTAGRPHGISYALVLMDQRGERVLGFANAHAYDGASDEDPFDHEHRDGRPGQRFRYAFTSAAALIEDFFTRVETACIRRGIAFEFEDDVS